MERFENKTGGPESNLSEFTEKYGATITAEGKTKSVYQIQFISEGYEDKIVVTVQVLFHDTTGSDIVITNMATLPEGHMGEGFGGIVVKNILQWAHDHSLKEVRVSQVHSYNESFWISNGFTKAKEPNLSNDFIYQTNLSPSPEEVKKMWERLEEKSKKAEINNSRENDEWEADYLTRHPTLPKETSRERGSEVKKLDVLIDIFESTHSLEELNAIVEISSDLEILFTKDFDLSSEKNIENAIALYEQHNPGYVEIYKKKMADIKAIVLSPEEARKLKIRIAAKKDLTPIVEILRDLSESNKDYKRLKARCSILMKAVGSLNKKKINHD
ncbi:MAG: hypothetical protein Q7K54_04665 [Candidatus Parcubacteria bacterium]|nr:hypothetical protein [Candidatus Parcubacteria bacterium]